MSWVLQVHGLTYTAAHPSEIERRSQEPLAWRLEAVIHYLTGGIGGLRNEAIVIEEVVDVYLNPHGALLAAPLEPRGVADAGVDERVRTRRDLPPRGGVRGRVAQKCPEPRAHAQA